ncbi:hypothetical protein [Lichenibacterium dinghuense]|uniref:hypothetical protein n=1 Tax=Lichenibacterium dinghuense TaxID=2895977 RepID=UPI001F2943C0|nr:hypothetical protein [Lichenibacterium sp. 6Y81]
MTRVLFVAQDKGGVGKTTLVRALIELVPDLQIFEVDTTRRMLEFEKKAKDGEARFFRVRVDPAQIERTRGRAAEEEFDDVIEALSCVKRPTVVDIGANTSRSFFTTLVQYLDDFARKETEIGVLIVMTAEPGALAEALWLRNFCDENKASMFVVENRVGGDVSETQAASIAKGGYISVLENQSLRSEAAKFLVARGMLHIPRMNAEVFEKDHGLAAGRRIYLSLVRFRTEAMQAVVPAANWLMDEI